VGSVSPGRVLVAGTGRVATGSGGLGESSLDSRCCQALESGKEGLSCPTHYIMSKYHHQTLFVKHKKKKITAGLMDRKKSVEFYSAGPKQTGYQGEGTPRGLPPSFTEGVLLK